MPVFDNDNDILVATVPLNVVVRNLDCIVLFLEVLVADNVLISIVCIGSIENTDFEGTNEKYSMDSTEGFKLDDFNVIVDSIIVVYIVLMII